MTNVIAPTIDRVVAGLLLTGGASRRMGADKSRLLVDGRHLAGHLAEMLVTVANPVREVGPGVTRLTHLVEERPGEGPLSAMVSGWDALCEDATPDSVVVLACDLPMLSVKLLRLLVEWPSDTSVVPVVDGRAQYLCARWSSAAMGSSRSHFAENASLRHFAESTDVEFIDERHWAAFVDAAEFEDVDQPEDFTRLGVRWQSNDLPAGGLRSQ